MKALITVGVSASGKSTLAKELAKQGWIEANRDWIRFNVVCPGSDWSNYKFTKKREADVTAEQESMVMIAASHEMNVVISDTNLNPKTRNKWVEFCEALGYEVEVRPLEVSLKEAWKRDTLRANGVGRDVIYKQWKQWLEFIEYKKYVPNPSLPNAIVFDIDGTLAKMNGRSPFEWHRVGEDDPNELVVDILEGLSITNQIVIVSGRDGICYDETEKWLIANGIHFDALIMREAGDCRKDDIVKSEIFWNHIEPYWNVRGWFDDRPQVVRMLHDIGIPNVIAVADQNEEF